MGGLRVASEVFCCWKEVRFLRSSLFSNCWIKDHMTILNPTSNELTPPRPAWLSGCITIFAILFAIVGIWNLVFGSLIAYIFFSARMLSTANIVLLLIIAGDCLIYFILAFRLKRQYWLLSLILLAVVWFMRPGPSWTAR